MKFNQGKFVLIIELLIAVYMISSLMVTEYKNYKIENYIAQFELENQRLTLENQDLNSQFDYFTSSEYQEKIAKQNFGLAISGEKVLVILEDDLTSDSEKFQQSIVQEKIDHYVSMPAFQKWVRFYTKD
ncbi:hypothetical protein HOH51_02380 [bacterium]|jgi:cell division protein FtsL|nr:hypothetical protein [bacterium]